MIKHSIMNLEKISLDLIEAQYKFKQHPENKNSKGILILIGGIELTNKGKSIKKLTELMDPRYLKIRANIPNKINPKQLIWQPYINSIPKKGELIIFYGNWYTDLLASTLYGDTKISENEFNQYLETIYEYEDYLKNNNVDIIKVWFEVSWEQLKDRLADIDLSKSVQRVPNFAWDNFPLDNWKNKSLYNKIQNLKQKFIQDWYLLDSDNNKEQNLQFAKLVLNHLKTPHPRPKKALKYQASPIYPQLTQIETTEIEKTQYSKSMKKLQRKVAEALRYSPKNVVFVFEGMDAAGKGSSIKRIIKYLDPYEYNIHSISAPEYFEQLHPYLWRFWTKYSSNGAINIFDRSWYGRVLVERVENLISATEWQNSYQEINNYEKQLTETNTIVLKFWLATSKEEQLKRFEKRQNTPQKRFKITEEDWRNREKWDDYLQAASDMFKYTDTEIAPWHIIANDNKLAARIEILQTILKRLQA